VAPDYDEILAGLGMSGDEDGGDSASGDEWSML